MVIWIALFELAVFVGWSPQKLQSISIHHKSYSQSQFITKVAASLNALQKSQSVSNYHRSYGQSYTVNYHREGTKDLSQILVPFFAMFEFFCLSFSPSLSLFLTHSLFSLLPSSTFSSYSMACTLYQFYDHFSSSGTITPFPSALRHSCSLGKDNL